MNERMSLSQQLRRAREERGESLEDVHKQTSISLEVLRGLEADRFDVIEPVFTRMVVAEYAGRYGMDVDSVLRQFDRTIAPALKVAQPPVPGSAAAAASRSLQPVVLSGWILRGGISLLILLVVAIVVFRNGDPPPEYSGISPQGAPADPSGEKSIGEGIEGRTGAVVAPDREESPSSMETSNPASVTEGHGPGPGPAPQVPASVAIDSTSTELDRGDTVAGISMQGQGSQHSPAANDSLLVLEIEAVDSTWVRIKWDHGGEFEATVPPGFKRSWETRNHFLVHSGRARGIRYWFQGELLGGGYLGDPSKVLRFKASKEGVILIGADPEPPAPPADSSP